MLPVSKEKIASFKTELTEGWYDHKSPAVNPKLVDLWVEIAEEFDAKFPDLVLWIAPASDSSLGMDVHKLIDGKWSEYMAIVHMDTPEKMTLWDETSGDTDDIECPFDKKVLEDFLAQFRQRCKS